MGKLGHIWLEIQTGEDETHRIALGESSEIFDQTLPALRFGGEAPYFVSLSFSYWLKRTHQARTEESILGVAQ